MKRGKVTAEKKAEVLARITATTDYAALAGCDLIAVFEDPSVKAEVTARVEAAIGPIASLPPTPPPCRSLAWPAPAPAPNSSSASISSRRSTR